VPGQSRHSRLDLTDAEQRDDVIGDLPSRLAKLDEKQGQTG